jgi:hypothetical protein
VKCNKNKSTLKLKALLTFFPLILAFLSEKCNVKFFTIYTTKSYMEGSSMIENPFVFFSHLLALCVCVCVYKSFFAHSLVRFEKGSFFASHPIPVLCFSFLHSSHILSHCVFCPSSRDLAIFSLFFNQQPTTTYPPAHFSVYIFISIFTACILS